LPEMGTSIVSLAKADSFPSVKRFLKVIPPYYTGERIRCHEGLGHRVQGIGVRVER